MYNFFNRTCTTSFLRGIIFKANRGEAKLSLVPPSAASSHSHEDQGELPFFSPDDEVAFGDSSLLGLKGSQTKDLFPSQEQIERAKKLHYVLCTKSEEAEASSLTTPLKLNLGGGLLFSHPYKGGIHFSF